MNILMLAPHPHVRGPIPKLTPHLADALRKLGCNVTLLPWGRHSDHETFSEKLLGRARDIATVRRALRAGDFDLLLVKTAHDWTSLARDVPLMFATTGLVPYRVLQFHGCTVDRLVAPGSRLFKFVSSLLIERCDGALVLSTEEQWQWRLFHPAGNYQVVKNPFIPRDVNVQPAHRAKLGLHPDLPVLVFVGRLIEAKGIFELVDALAAVREQAPCQLLMVGDGPERDRLERRIATRGISGDVHFTGYLSGDDLLRAYRCADVFILPSWTEGMPFAILEAMCSGLPVITTRLRGMADHLVQDVHTLFVRVKDPTSLSEAIATLVVDADMRLRMGAANREKVHEFAPDVVGREYLAALKSIIGSETTPASSG